MLIPFVKERQARWHRLYELVERAEKNRLKLFTKEELLELSALYRQGVTDLAQAKAQGISQDHIILLNDLVRRAYHIIYRSEPISLGQLKRLIFIEFPKLFWENWRIVCLAFGLLIIGWAVGFYGYLNDLNFLSGILPAEFATEVFKRYQKNTWFNNQLTERPYISFWIMKNNIMVALNAFAGGMLLGVLTVGALLYNGLILGVLSAHFTKQGHLLSFWAMILPHGVIELTAIVLSAASGFLLAKIILFPGEYTRSDAFKLYGSKAIQMASGTVVLLVIAGLIEGFLSTTTTKIIPESVRLIFAGLTAVLLCGYLGSYWWRQRYSEN